MRSINYSEERTETRTPITIRITLVSTLPNSYILYVGTLQFLLKQKCYKKVFIY